jgi:hypothetical protein
VGGLPFNTEDEALREHFGQCGAIHSVRVIRDKRTGIGKGIAYVRFMVWAGMGQGIAYVQFMVWDGDGPRALRTSILWYGRGWAKGNACVRFMVRAGMGQGQCVRPVYGMGGDGPGHCVRPVYGMGGDGPRALRASGQASDCSTVTCTRSAADRSDPSIISRRAVCSRVVWL